MTDNEYILEVHSFMRYAKRMHNIIDWYADINSIVLACDNITFTKLRLYADTHYPNLTILAMTVPTFIARRMNNETLLH